MQIQKARVDSITLANEELEKEKKSASSVLDAENSRLVDATRYGSSHNANVASRFAAAGDSRFAIRLVCWKLIQS